MLREQWGDWPSHHRRDGICLVGIRVLAKAGVRWLPLLSFVRADTAEATVTMKKRTAFSLLAVPSPGVHPNWPRART
jgi:hypothetical protein